MVNERNWALNNKMPSIFREPGMWNLRWTMELGDEGGGGHDRIQKGLAIQQ